MRTCTRCSQKYEPGDGGRPGKDRDECHKPYQDLAEVLQKAAHYLSDRGRYEQAEPLYERALRIGQQIWGPEHPQVASTLCDLAFLYDNLGQYQQAESLFQRALSLWESVRGPAHPASARPLYGLGTIWWKQGNYEQAERVYQQAYALLEQAQEAEPLYEALLLSGLDWAISPSNEGSRRGRNASISERCLMSSS